MIKGRGAGRGGDAINDIGSMKVQAAFKDAFGERAIADLLILSHYSPNNHHIKVYTTTVQPKVRNIFLHFF